MGHGWGTKPAHTSCLSYLLQSGWIDSLAVTAVTKRLVDVDDEKLEAVRRLLGTQALKATVESALDEVLALDRRRRQLLAEREAPTERLHADVDERRSAWG